MPPITLGQIAGIIAAVAFVALVALLAVPLLKLGKVLDELKTTVHDMGAESVPILTELKGTVTATNNELEKLAYVTQDVSKVSGHATVVSENAAQVTTLLHQAVAEPLVKVAAFNHGVKKAVNGLRESASGSSVAKRVK